MKYRAIVTTPSGLPITQRCGLLGVSRSGFYAWCTRQESRRAQHNQQLVAEMRRIHAEVDRTYGSPRMQQELVARGYACGRHRVARLMQRHGVRAKQARRFRVTTASDHGLPVAPNRLERQFTVAGPDRMWLADLTYVWTDEGWSYLAVVLDAYSRRIVGWALGARLTTALTLVALRAALQTRRPAPGLLHHSDQGTQYASAAYQAVLGQHGLVGSMSRRGDCWDKRGGGKLLSLGEDRAAVRSAVRHAARGAHRSARLHRAVLQPAAAALDARVSQPRAVRVANRRLNACPRKRGKITSRSSDEQLTHHQGLPRHVYHKWPRQGRPTSC